MRIPESEWRWLGGAGHFICGDRCRFHMTTVIGSRVISTVGDFYKCEKDEIPSPMGASPHLFETMVFAADGVDSCGCHPSVTDWSELWSRRWMTATEATAGHMETCERFAHQEGTK